MKSQLPDPPRLILASSSPRRRQMLAGLGLAFELRPIDVDETPRSGEAPRAYVSRLAEGKAQASADAATTPQDEVILAADTIVAAGGDLLGKPRDEADARAMLERLSGREHEVLTGVAVLRPGRGLRLAAVEVTRVRFAELEPAEIDWYVTSGEPLDKAGAYAVQGLGALLVDGIDGNYSNVVGLPLPATYRLLRQAGYPLLDLAAAS